MAENYIGVICSAIPPLRAPIIRYFTQATRGQAPQQSFKRKEKKNYTLTTDSSGYTLDDLVVDSRRRSAPRDSDLYKVRGALRVGNMADSQGHPYPANTMKSLSPIPSQSDREEGDEKNMMA